MNLTIQSNRRQFLKRMGISAAALPFLPYLPTFASPIATASRRQRIIFLFSPNGTVPDDFWPDAQGPDFALKRILAPLAPYQDRMLTLRGISNRIRGDGDGHMRGMSCLLTADELLPGNIQGGSDRPAGWASHRSIDQEIRNFLQSNPATATRFGSLELGVAVPNRADPWTRNTYAGPNQPLAPISDPYALFGKIYGSTRDRAHLGSVLDDVRGDLTTLAKRLDADERSLLEQHESFIRDLETDLQSAETTQLMFPAPELEPGVALENDGIPKISEMQIDLLVSAMANDLTRVASLQYEASVGQAKMRWLGVNEDHHALSHEPDTNREAQEKLVKINTWFCEQIAMLAGKLDAIPEPGGSGTMLDHTTIIWTNELGKGNSHTLDNIPFVMVGGGLGYSMGRSLAWDNVPHNRLWLSLANAFGNPITMFGQEQYCDGGALSIG